MKLELNKTKRNVKEKHVHSEMSVLNGVVVLLLAVAAGRAANENAAYFGSVLFTVADLGRDCWTCERLGLLTTHMLMRDFMPNVGNFKVEDDSYIDDIVAYFKALLEVIRNSTHGNIKHVMLLAFTDTLGGYMKHIVLPVSKYAFYAGKVEYGSIIKLYQLYDEVKNYLHTNGDTWAKPWSKAGKHIQAKPMDLKKATTTDPCSGLIYSTNKGEATSMQSSTCAMHFYMPYFDSKSHPTAIAVPFKILGLRNLESRVASHIVVKYYLAAMKCMISRNAAEIDMEKFETDYYVLIMTKIMPHLSDDKFYAGFGGVLRILETIKQKGGVKSHEMGNMQVMPESEVHDAVQTFGDESELMPGDERPKQDNKNAAKAGSAAALSKKKASMVFIWLMILLLVFICLIIIYICLKIKKRHGKKSEGQQISDTLVACKEDTCPLHGDIGDESLPSSASKGASKANSKASSKGTMDPTPAQSKSSADDAEKASKATEEKGIAANYAIMQVKPSRVTKFMESSKSSNADVQHSSSQDSYSKDSDSKSNKMIGVQLQSGLFPYPSSGASQSKAGSSPGEYDDVKRPVIFGYDFLTTTEDTSSSMETTDGENEDAAQLSK